MLKPYSIEKTLTINGMTFSCPSYIDLLDEERENRTRRSGIRNEGLDSLWYFLEAASPDFRDDIILKKAFFGRRVIEFYNKKQKFTENDFITWYWKMTVMPVEHFSFNDLKKIDADKVIQYYCERQVATINTIIEQLKE